MASRGLLTHLKNSVERMEQALTSKPVVRDLGADWTAEKQLDLRKHILPHAARIPTHMETLERCTAKLKPEVTGISLMIGNGVTSSSARYFFYEHFCGLRYRNPTLKYDIDMDSSKSQVRLHLDPALSPTREHIDIATNGKVPHQIMDELCAAYAEYGDASTCTTQFNWKTDPESMQSPIEATEQRLHKTKLQVDELEAQAVRHDVSTPIEISDLPLEQGEQLNLDLIFKPIDLLDTENRAPPTNPREELRERRRVEKLERKNKKLLMILRSKAEEEARETAES
ncbi:uncharacterized protein LOC135831087 [Sycon ciliatum]|uniref:uncharacterized protein LOC135831087 n=1 Tax=Sycon ciliatum TaxID=27933 RepID=UPI0020A8FEC8|eukprot:scpid20480/ scgid19695/ 